MKQFKLVISIPHNNRRESVHVAQMLREAAGNVEYQTIIPEHRLVYDGVGGQKYKWKYEEGEEEVEAKRRAG